MSEVKISHANIFLREARLQRGWSQQNLADCLDIATITVNRWERGKQRPTAHYRLKLCALFGKSEAELGLVEEKTEVVPSSDEEEQENCIQLIDKVSLIHLIDRAEPSSCPDKAPIHVSFVAQEPSRRLLVYPNIPRVISLPQRREKTTLFLVMLTMIMLLILGIAIMLMFWKTSCIVFW